jgi:dynein heavy chain
MEELTLGFAGEFTISEAMDRLTVNLYQGSVPQEWVKLSWPSLRTLPMWLHDLNKRIIQLQDWLESPNDVPRVTWISGLVNPNSFLTAIKQIQAQRSGAELDKLVIHTEITKKMGVDDVDGPPREGAYVCGLSMQGARWDCDSGTVKASRPKEMFSPMPVMNCRAVKADKMDALNIFHCPVYKTEQRGPTFVFSAQLKTKTLAARWILASVALIMDIGE